MQLKINVKFGTCSCGKEIEEYDTVTRSGELLHHGYPDRYCHCKCGVEWGKHGKEYTLTEEIKKTLHVS